MLRGSYDWTSDRDYKHERAIYEYWLAYTTNAYNKDEVLRDMFRTIGKKL